MSSDKYTMADSNYIQLGFIREKNDTIESIVIDHNLTYQESAAVNYDTIDARGSLGAIYTYNSTKERQFQLEIEVVDYTGDGIRIENAKRLLRKWMQPKIKEGNIIAPPPVLEFSYVGMTQETSYVQNTDGTFYDETANVICLLLNYDIRVDSKIGWNMNRTDMQYVTGKGSASGGAIKTPRATPKTMNVSMTLVDIESRFRNQTIPGRG